MPKSNEMSQGQKQVQEHPQPSGIELAYEKWIPNSELDKGCFIMPDKYGLDNHSRVRLQFFCTLLIYVIAKKEEPLSNGVYVKYVYKTFEACQLGWNLDFDTLQAKIEYFQATKVFIINDNEVKVLDVQKENKDNDDDSSRPNGSLQRKVENLSLDSSKTLAPPNGTSNGSSNGSPNGSTHDPLSKSFAKTSASSVTSVSNSSSTNTTYAHSFPLDQLVNKFLDRSYRDVEAVEIDNLSVPAQIFIDRLILLREFLKGCKDVWQPTDEVIQPSQAVMVNLNLMANIP